MVNEPTAAVAVELRSPTVQDGAGMWQLAHHVGGLDVNSSYAYLLWCRDFAATSVVAASAGRLIGFVTGYRRPDDPGVLMVWQVGVDPSARGQGLAGRMLGALLDRPGMRDATHLETTVTPDNGASLALFRGLARRLGASVDETVLFDVTDFPDAHDAEHLLRIGPLG